MTADRKDQLALPKAVADYMGTTTGNLAQMRYRGTGPKFIKLGHRAIRYRWSDIEAWTKPKTLTQQNQNSKPKTQPKEPNQAEPNFQNQREGQPHRSRTRQERDNDLEKRNNHLP